jgi:hypothetical protein
MPARVRPQPPRDRKWNLCADDHLVFHCWPPFDACHRAIAVSSVITSYNGTRVRPQPRTAGTGVMEISP